MKADANLTGIHVVLEGKSRKTDIMSVLVMGYTSLDFFVDEEKIYNTHMDDECDYFTPLPPGDHVFIHQEKVKGAAVVIGVPWGMCRKEYRFTIDEGEVVLINFERDQDACLEALFENINSPDSIRVLKTGYFNTE